MNLRLGLGLGAIAAVVAVGCAAGGDATDDPASAELAATAACTHPLPAADRKRKVVVSHPYGNGDDNPMKKLEVLDLSASGELTKTGAMFELYKPVYGPIVFTPDGQIGLVPQDDGKIGVFRFDSHGVVHVVPQSFSVDFWAKDIAIDSTGTRVFVSDANTGANGGGVYELALGCDGKLTMKGLVVQGGQAYALGFFPASPNKAVLAAGYAFGSVEPTDAFLLDMKHAPAILAKGIGFGDHSAIVSSLAVTQDGKFALIGDDAYTAGNRVAVVEVATMKQKQMLTTEAPFAIVASVFNNAAIVVNGDAADNVTALRYDKTNVETPFAITGFVSYNYPRPQLPGAAVQLRRGRLTGRVLVAELLAVRQLQFKRDGTIEDVAQTTWDKSFDTVLGTVGVQP